MKTFIAKLDLLTKAANVQDLWDAHARQMALYGFDRIMYGFTRHRTAQSLGNRQDWVLLSTQTPEYMAGFFDQNLYQHAPMIRWAMKNDGACSWRWISEMRAKNELSPDESRVVDFNCRMGVTAGYTISFRSLSQRAKGAVALTAAPGMTQDDVDQLWVQHGDAIIMMNNVMHLKLLSLPHEGDRQLTRRQREVLQWIGDGKSVQDTAQLLGLTPATVDKHLRLARESLDVSTTAQAVVKAAFYNQMFLLDVAS